MVTCMLTCKSGYRLGKTSDKNGCQSCTCVIPTGIGNVTITVIGNLRKPDKRGRFSAILYMGDNF